MLQKMKSYVDFYKHFHGARPEVDCAQAWCNYKAQKHDQQMAGMRHALLAVKFFFSFNVISSFIIIYTQIQGGSSFEDVRHLLPAGVFGPAIEEVPSYVTEDNQN